MRELTLLLVDDHEAFLNAAQRELRPHTWLRVLGRALNGREAVLRTEELRPAVVVMDLAMPEMGGLQATRLIKAQDEPPFVIIASHFDDAEHREHAHAAGADAFIGKADYARDLLPILERLAADPGHA
jgi:DNA-binding NarL/FixJ family response regulator